MSRDTKPCPTCKGKGYKVIHDMGLTVDSRECGICHGSGVSDPYHTANSDQVGHRNGVVRATENNHTDTEQGVNEKLTVAPQQDSNQGLEALIHGYTITCATKEHNHERMLVKAIQSWCNQEKVKELEGLINLNKPIFVYGDFKHRSDMKVDYEWVEKLLNKLKERIQALKEGQE